MASDHTRSNTEMISEFTAFTGVAEDLATYYLEQSGWKLESAVDNFFDSLATDGRQGDENNPIMVSDDSPEVPSADHVAASSCHVDVQGGIPNLSVLSWNVDGLDERNIIERTRKVCHVINSRKPDVVFLQEVVPDTLTMFQSRCSGYSCKYGPSQAYFNIMLLKISSIKTTEDPHNTFFRSSQMGRHVLHQSALFNGKIQLALMTSHLESTAKCAAERKNQFQQVLTSMNQKPPQANVIFGADTNLRDKEVSSIGGLPRGILDAWEESGSPDDAKFTWDVSTNDNLDWQFPNKPKIRFDRLFVRPAQGQHSLKVVSVSLVGQERLAGCGRFASDHWGVWCEFAQFGEEKE